MRERGMAAGMGSRCGGLKQIDPVENNGESGVTGKGESKEFETYEKSGKQQEIQEKIVDTPEYVLYNV